MDGLPSNPQKPFQIVSSGGKFLAISTNSHSSLMAMTQLEGFVVRKATLNDLPQVMQINLETLPENYPEYFYQEIYERYSDAFFVAEADQKLVGYIMCRIEGGVSNFGRRWVRRGHIVSVAVLPVHRRQGLAMELIAKAIAAMRQQYEAKEMMLEVRMTNVPAIKLYEKMGFTRIRSLESYYRNGEDALLMALKPKQTPDL
jgi:ribosomal-protein-alanine N-acetyltransferase